MFTKANTSVLLVLRATPETIVQFHDELSNKLPTLKGKWNFAFKIFRNNLYSIAPEAAATHTTLPDTHFLYTLTLSYLHDSCITLVNKTTAAVFSHVVEEELKSPESLAIPNEHLHGGATSGMNDPFDYMVNQRMQSMWTQRQVIRGDGGQIYELENGKLVIRTANVALHGNFRGLLIQIEVEGHEGEFEALLKKYDIPAGNMSHATMGTSDAYGDLALQYLEMLNF